jgi:hypothetical protein
MVHYLLLAHIEIAHLGRIILSSNKLSRPDFKISVSLRFWSYECRNSEGLIPWHGLMWASLNLVNFFPAPTLVQRSSSEGIDLEQAFVSAEEVLGGADEGAEVATLCVFFKRP